MGEQATRAFKSAVGASRLIWPHGIAYDEKLTLAME